MPTNYAVYAAFLSAVAASCSALSAFLVMRIQRRNLIETVRPELIPLNWSRQDRGEGDDTHEVIAFKQIKNAGKGPAFNVAVRMSGQIPNGRFSICHMPTMRIALIAPGETVSVSGEANVGWKKLKTGDPGEPQVVFLNMILGLTDSRNVHHTTHYGAIALNPAGTNGDLAPGLFWNYRYIERKPLWRIKLASKTRFHLNKVKGRFTNNQKQLRKLMFELDKEKAANGQ